MSASPSQLSSQLSSLSLEQQAKLRCFLPLSESSHKGSSGRIGVLGGSDMYTGAPYYAGMSALQAGADLAYVFTAREAAAAIKSYSPELMVVPAYSATDYNQLLDAHATEPAADDRLAADRAVDAMVKVVEPWLERMHCLVVGPGLGRNPLVMEATAKIIELAKSRQLALVVDADALFLLTHYQSLLSGYRRAVVTPNVVEYQRLVEQNVDLTGVTVLRKGRVDVITIGGNDYDSVECDEQGGLKRSGGIGDVLAGTLGTFLGWQSILHPVSLAGEDSLSVEPKEEEMARRHDWQLSCWTACCVVKRATHQAFELKRRSMTAPDVLAQLGATINHMETDGTSKH